MLGLRQFSQSRLCVDLGVSHMRVQPLQTLPLLGCFNRQIFGQRIDISHDLFDLGDVLFPLVYGLLLEVSLGQKLDSKKAFFNGIFLLLIFHLLLL